MAMTLRTSRLRLTQAIYFGFPPSAVGSGFLKADGSVPLTNDWNAGNFNINSRNSTGWFNVVAFGADPTGSASSNAAINATIVAANGGIVYFPRGTYLIDQQITIAVSSTHILGDGRDATVINFMPAAPPGPRKCFAFTAGAGTINNCSIRGFEFRSADIGSKKTAIDISDAVNFMVDDINISGGWTGANSIGIQVAGRQNVRLQNIAISDADLPFVIAVNPNFPSLSFDHSSIESSELVVSAGSNNPVITVEDGAGMTNASFAHIALVKGGPGILMNNTLMATAYQAITIEDVRAEQGNDPTAYAIDLRSSSGQIQTLQIKTAILGFERNGLRLTNAKWPMVDGLLYAGVGGTTSINLSATVEGFSIRNSFLQSGSSVIDASVVPTAISHHLGGNPPFTSIGTLTPGTVDPLSVGSTSQMKVTSTGQLGLGGIVPDQDLTLSSISQIHVLGGNTNIYSEPAAPGATTLNFGALSFGAPGYLSNGASLRIQTDAINNGTILCSTNAAERLRIDQTGNVGIATAGTATRTLDLNGVQRYRGQAAPAVSEANSGTIYFDSATNKLKASLNGSAYVDVIGSGGLTGSGTAGQVAYWDGVTSLASPSAIYVDGVNNRLGINVPVPTYPLDIDGDINVINAPATIRVAGDPVMQAGSGATKLGGTHGTITASDTAIGSGAMANASGAGAGGNTAIGLQAMGLSTAAENNTAVGALALDATQGVANVAVGVAAGLTNTTGSYNIFIGETADATAGNLNNAAAIGRGATIAQSNSLSIGGGIQGVGIKTATPKTTLDVGGSLAVFPVEVTLVNGLNSDVTTLVAAGMLRIVGPTGGFSVGGFSIPTGIPAVTGPTGGQVLYVFNSEAQQMTIVNEDLLSTDIKRIKTLTGGDVVLRAGTSAATFVYDDSVDRFILMSSN